MVPRIALDTLPSLHWPNVMFWPVYRVACTCSDNPQYMYAFPAPRASLLFRFFNNSSSPSCFLIKISTCITYVFSSLAPGTQKLAPGPSLRFLRPPRSQGRRFLGPNEMGYRHPREGKHRLGRRRLQGNSRILRRIPVQTPQVQVRTAPLPSQRLPLRHHLPVHPERGGGLASRHHHQADAPGNSGLIGRS